MKHKELQAGTVSPTFYAKNGKEMAMTQKINLINIFFETCDI
jgi:hypothetical protein